MRRLPVLLLLLFPFLCIIHAKLVQVQIVHRHGARSFIDKHETDPRREESSPTLYPAGIEQLKKLGSYCRSEYIEENAPFVIDGFDLASDLQQQVLSRTSNFQRTQLSARAFLSGLFPDQHEQIPTLVFNGSKSDWIIRGYALCPRLAQRFQDFVTKDKEYLKVKKENEAFVARLAKQLGYSDEDTIFENIFNIFDEYNIIQNEYDGEKYKDREKLSTEDMKKLKGLADWYESRKFSFGTQNVQVGGGLISMMMEYARSVKRRSSQGYRIVHISGHYPTLLTVLASLRSKNEGDIEFPGDGIPEFGSALIFEVHDEDGELWIRMKWFRGGDGDADVKSFAIGRGECKDGEKGCKMSSVEELLGFDSFPDERFCSECKSMSGVCEFVRRSESGGDGVEGSQVCSIGSRATSGAIGGGLVLVMGLGVWLLYSFLVGKKKRMGMERAAMDGIEEGAVFA